MRRRMVGPLAALLVVVAALFSPAQEQAGGRLALESYSRVPDRESPEAERLAADILSGRVDPLELLRHLSPRVQIAPGAVYDAKCSVALSVFQMESFVRFSKLTAAFTFGHSMPDELARHMRLSEAEQQAVNPMEVVQWMQWDGAPRSRPGGRAFHGAVAFYDGIGYRRGLVYVEIPFEAPRGAQGQQLKATVRPVMVLGECPDIPTGPGVLITLD